MKKVKSAAEIAMEKAQQMEVSENEDAGEYREYIKAAEILAASLLENKTDPLKAKEAFDRYPDAAKEEVLKLFYGKFAAGINFHNAPTLIDVLQYVSRDENIRKACRELLPLHEELNRRMEEELAEAHEESARIARQQLAMEGITGSALYHVYPRQQDKSEVIKQKFAEEFNRQVSGFCSFLASKT